jgi:hypothetical protein
MKTMDELSLQRRVGLLDTSLKLLSALLVTMGVSLLTAVLFMVNEKVLKIAGEEIMISDRTVMAVAVALLLLVVASGLVSLYRLRYGWLLVFFIASLVLLMGLLMGTRTNTLIMVSFFVMMFLSLLLWADAVVFYFWDLYT